MMLGGEGAAVAELTSPIDNSRAVVVSNLTTMLLAIKHPPCSRGFPRPSLAFNTLFPL
jgi:hypothetical protein